jgi:uncharacterized FlgJ-related protein
MQKGVKFYTEKKLINTRIMSDRVHQNALSTSHQWEKKNRIAIQKVIKRYLIKRTEGDCEAIENRNYRKAK